MGMERTLEIPGYTRTTRKPGPGDTKSAEAQGPCVALPCLLPGSPRGSPGGSRAARVSRDWAEGEGKGTSSCQAGFYTKPCPSADVELEDTKEAKFNRCLCLKGIWFMFFIFTGNPGDPHKILKLQCTGFLKMTLKWAYFIMLNNTIFRCGTEWVRNLNHAHCSLLPLCPEFSRVSPQ